MPTFTDLGVDATRVSQLAAQAIVEPTSIQALAVPVLLEGKDALIHAQTGSGKTLAYLLPMFARIAKFPAQETGVPGAAAPNAIILVPTQELGIQVRDVAKALAVPDGWDVQALIGGANPARQIEALRKRPRIVVGTPGRILQMMRENKLSGSSVKVLVGDEADQLFEPAHRADLEAIMKAISPSRQTILVTATPGGTGMPDWGTRYLKDGQLLRADDDMKLPASLTHQAFVIDPREKVELVRRLVRHLNPVGAIAFVNRPADADWWAEKLKYNQLRAAALHSGVHKLERASIMRDFKAGKLQLLLATELAARGLDLSGVSIIFNMELPTDAGHYVHRVGRTARMGRPGTAITLVAPQEAFVLGKLEKALDIKFERPVLKAGEVREATPRDVEKAVFRARHEDKKAEVKAVVAAKIEAGEPIYKVKKPKAKPITNRQLEKGKAKKAKKKADAAWRSKKPPTPEAPTAPPEGGEA